MVINDKLKGEFYRAPMTKLSSRRNIVNQLNELIDYFNNISNILNESFDSITTERERMVSELVKIQEQILHFKYIITNFNIEVDQHIYERLQQTILNFDNVVTQFTNKYSNNLFDHNGSIDDNIDTSTSAVLREWDKSVNSLSSTLGIQWYGGKISEASVLNKLNNVLHIVKMNNYEGNNHEDYINSGIILEVFIYTSKGMVWLVLGENGLYGHNFYVKYQSSNMNYSIKLGSKSYNAKSSYDLNRVDFDFILSDLIGNETGDVYIKFCTNIPANNESGKCVYLLNGINSFKCYENLRNIIDFTNGSLYQDNKDLAFYQQSDTYLKKLVNVGSHISTPNIINLVEKNYPIPESNDDEIDEYFSYLKSVANTNRTKHSISTINPNGTVMSGIPEEYSGIVIENSSDVVGTGYISSEEKTNNYLKNDPDYIKGDMNVNLLDHRTTGDVSVLSDNEELLVVEGVTDENKVVSHNPFSEFDVSKTGIKNWAWNNDETMNKFDYRKNFISNLFDAEKIILKAGTDEYNTVSHMLVSETPYAYGMLIAGSGNGIYYSTDGGATWTKTSLNSGMINTLIMANDGTIVAGTYNNGIYYSTDNGKTWVQSSLDNSNGGFNALIVANDGTIIAGSYNYKGIYYSTDNGRTWTQSSLEDVNIESLTIANNGTVIAGSGGDGIYYSTDNGATWTQSSLESDYIHSLMVTNDGTVIAGSNNEHGIYYSTNNGRTWVQSSLDDKDIRSFAIANNGTVIACGYGIYYSTDNGKTWSQSNRSSGYVNSLTVANDGTIIAGSDSGEGISYSTDNGEMWSQSSLESDYIRSLTVANDGTIIAGSGDDNGIYYSADNGRTWAQSSLDSGTIRSLTVANDSTADISFAINNFETVSIGDFKIFNHPKGLMYYNSSTPSLQLTSFDNSYHFNSYCKYSDSVLYLGTKSGIIKVEINTNNEISFTKTNIIAGEFGSFAKFNNGMIYAFRLNNEIFSQRTDGGIGNNRYFLKDFMYVLYDNIWYEFTDLCENVLGIDSSEINKISYETNQTLISLLSDPNKVLNSVYKLDENSVLIMKNQGNHLNHFKMIGDTIKGVSLPLVKIDINSIETNPSYNMELTSDLTKLEYTKFNKYLIISGLNVSGDYKYQIYNTTTNKYETITYGNTANNALRKNLYEQIFKPSNNRLENVLYVNDTVSYVSDLMKDSIFITLPNGKPMMVANYGNIDDISIGPNNLICLSKKIDDKLSVEIIDINTNTIKNIEYDFIEDSDSGMNFKILSNSIDVDNIFVNMIVINEYYNMYAHATVVSYPYNEKISEDVIGFSSNQLTK